MNSKTTKTRAAATKKGASGGKRPASSRKGARPDAADAQTSAAAEAATQEQAGPPLMVEVVWGDITKAEGDVHFVGHYMGVLPQKAEAALDEAMSCGDGADGKEGEDGKPGRDRKDGIIREWTKRGLLQGALGEITFFPWDPGKLIGVAGMGRPGTFHRPQLKILARSIARSVGLLPRRHTVATVLIGAGIGNLRLKDAAQTMVEGVAEALKEDPSLRLTTLRIVERYRDRATDILDALKNLNAKELGLELHESVLDGEEGAVSPEFSCSLLLASLAEPKGAAADSASNLFQLLGELPPKGKIPLKAHEKFKKIVDNCEVPEGEERVRRLAMRLRLRDDDDEQPPDPIPARVAFWADGDDIHAAAITNTVTVTERTIANRMGLVKQAVERLTGPHDAPSEDKQAEWREKRTGWAATLSRLLVHADVKDILTRGDSLIVEVDAKLAPVQWEMLPSAQDNNLPLGVTRPLARQLRTSYSPRLDDLHPRGSLKALVIGDPGDPDKGQSLKDARTEAYKVYKLLTSKELKIETDVLIGAPQDGTNAGTFVGDDGKGLPAADYFEVVHLLLGKGYDIVHYCGHAEFDPKNPERAGWSFKGGVLTARELEGMERPPSLVVANACVTALLAQSGDTGGAAAGNPARKNYPGLVASLAEEFFRRGVSDYIGTAWQVKSGAAEQFATTLYTELVQGETLGDAVQSARKKLYEDYGTSSAVWAAYQHYGDPTRTFATSKERGKP